MLTFLVFAELSTSRLLPVSLPARQARDIACFISIEPMAIDWKDFPFPINERKYLPVQTKT